MFLAIRPPCLIIVNLPVQEAIFGVATLIPDPPLGVYGCLDPEIGYRIKINMFQCVAADPGDQPGGSDTFRVDRFIQRDPAPDVEMVTAKVTTVSNVPSPSDP